MPDQASGAGCSSRRGTCSMACPMPVTAPADPYARCSPRRMARTGRVGWWLRWVPASWLASEAPAKGTRASSASASASTVRMLTCAHMEAIDH